jgi:hypothetical protein
MNLLKYLNLARQKKMTMFTDTTLQLRKEHSDLLATLKGPNLEIELDDLLLLMKSSDVALVLEALQLIESAVLSEPIHGFEYTFAYEFIT